MLTDAYVGGGGGVKNRQNHAYVIYGRPLSKIALAIRASDDRLRKPPLK